MTKVQTLRNKWWAGQDAYNDAIDTLGVNAAETIALEEAATEAHTNYMEFATAHGII